jgi:hypothetical protein
MSVDNALAMVRQEIDTQIRRLQAVGAAIDAVQASAASRRGDSAWQRLLAVVADAASISRNPVEADAGYDALPPEVAAWLGELADRPGWATLSGRLAALREAEWDDPQIGEVAAGLARLVPVELLPDDLTAPQGFALLVGPRASPAQVRCLLEAGRRARRRRKPTRAQQAGESS